MGREEIEVFLATAVGMIAVDPEQADGTVPPAGRIAGEGAADFDVFFDAGGFDGCEKFVESRILIGHVCAEIGETGMWIDGDNRPSAISAGDGSKHDRRFTFKAANFHDGPLRGSASGQGAEEPNLIFDHKPGDVASTLPGVFYGLIDVVGQLHLESNPIVD